jgi:hypothetical protein
VNQIVEFLQEEPEPVVVAAPVVPKVQENEEEGEDGE